MRFCIGGDDVSPRVAFWIFTIGFLFILAGCAATGIYYNNLNALIRSERYIDAKTLLESDSSAKSFYTSKNELLFWLDRGFLEHLSGEYQQSNLSFERAKKISQELFTKSISAEASSFLISDNMLPYAGEDFEVVMVNIFSALNYVLLGDYEGALVELRQVDAFLKKLELYYDGKTSYKEDAFARYLAGLIYEASGEINDAHISYLRALEAYKKYYEKNYSVLTPKEVLYDALRTAKMLGFSQRADELEKNYGVILPDEEKKVLTTRNKKEYGEIIVLIYAGLAPFKVDDFFEISFGRAWFYVGSVKVSDDERGEFERANRIARSISADEQVVMAFPKYIPSEYRARSFSVKVSSKSGNEILSEINLSLAEDIGEIAVKSLQERIGRIRIKTIARAAIKYALSKKISSDVARSSGDKFLGFLTQKVLSVAATATELADKRSWRTLPDKIFVGRISGLPAGLEYSLIVDFRDDYGDLIGSKEIKDISFDKAGRKFIILRSAM